MAVRRKIRQSHSEKEGKYRSGIRLKEKDRGDLCRRKQCSGTINTWGRDKQENRNKTQLEGKDWRILACQETGDSMNQKWYVLELEVKPGKEAWLQGKIGRMHRILCMRGRSGTLLLACSLPFFTFLPFFLFLLLFFFFPLSYLNPVLIHTSNLASPNWALLSFGCHNTDENHVYCLKRRDSSSAM